MQIIVLDASLGAIFLDALRWGKVYSAPNALKSNDLFNRDFRHHLKMGGDENGRFQCASHSAGRAMHVLWTDSGGDRRVPGRMHNKKILGMQACNEARSTFECLSQSNTVNVQVFGVS